MKVRELLEKLRRLESEGVDLEEEVVVGYYHLQDGLLKDLSLEDVDSIICTVTDEEGHEMRKVRAVELSVYDIRKKPNKKKDFRHYD